MADHVIWHVPGPSAICGDHVGRAAVVQYFRRRRALTGETLVRVLARLLNAAARRTHSARFLTALHARIYPAWVGYVDFCMLALTAGILAVLVSRAAAPTANRPSR